jgi:polysaccharide pyruvyl transferase WcaK-like protein
VIAVRLHAAVFARSARVPAVCVSYDPKVAAFAASAGYEALDPDETLRRRLADAALKALGTVPPPLPAAEPTDADAFEKLYALR